MILDLKQIMKLPTANKCVLLLATQLLAVKELAGNAHDATILKLWKIINIDWGVTDEIAWCASAHNAILKLCECHYFESGLARKTLESKFVVEESEALAGDSVVFSRGSDPTKGHVGIFIRYEDNDVICLGGNQSNEFKASRYKRSKMIGLRRPTFLSVTT